MTAERTAPAQAAGPAGGQSWLALAAYGALGLPLAMAALPVYVQIPAYYSTQLGLALAGTGWVLFLARLVDTVQDPWLGRWIDRLQGAGLRRWFWLGAILLALGFSGLWLPPVKGGYLLLWLGVMLVLAYTAHSMLNIAYLAWGARLTASSNSPTPEAQPTAASAAENSDKSQNIGTAAPAAGGLLLGAAGWREGLGLAGVVVASVVPAYWLAQPAAERSNGLWWYCGFFVLALLLGVGLLQRWAPVWQRAAVTQPSWRESWQQWRGNRAFVGLCWPYWINAVSVAIPATLAPFFIQDRLQAGAQIGLFLGAYFLAAAIGLPLWVRLAARLGTLCTWRLGMLLALLAFCGASLLGAGDTQAYLLICILAGLALGADLALPPVLLAGCIRPGEAAAGYFGLWTLLGKLALAVSGLALPLLALLDYQPGQPAGPALAWVYAGLPCLFKLAALCLLRRYPAPERLESHHA
ncbi:MFS transporter [Chitinibacter tainanensis]|uniref:MFS transporter n=1 Tax=Chitinibacter tainanensis TaxID=230667 RepID=UPI000422E3F0|nr:MFS transporter [Chitinibacter tainanensis]